MKKRYRISVPGNTYKKENEEKRSWTNVGVAFENDNGSISCKIDKNISVCNEFVLFEKDDN